MVPGTFRLLLEKMMNDYIKVALKNEIPEDTGKLVEVDGRPIALFKVKGKVYAIDAVCPHAGGPLAEGGVHDGHVMCPWHGWEFNLKDGVCAFNDSIKQPVFSVKEEGDEVYLRL